MWPIYKIDSPYPIQKPSIPTSPTLILLFFITQNRWGRIHTKKIMYSSSPQAKNIWSFPQTQSFSRHFKGQETHLWPWLIWNGAQAPCESRVVEVHHPYAEHHSPWLETSPTRQSSSLWRRFLFFDETGGFQSRWIFVALNTSPQKISGPLRRNHVKRRSSSDSSRFAFLFSLRACST